jgi:glutamate decarboxylase
MVHLNRVSTTKEISEQKSQFEAIDASTTINLTPEDEADDFTATVYGSKYAAEDLPRHEMPDTEMPPSVYVHKILAVKPFRVHYQRQSWNDLWAIG